MKKILHTRVTCSSNAGDLILGDATKWWFEKEILKNKHEVEWTCANSRLKFDYRSVERLNKEFDYLLVGGGGMLLPDSHPNKVSGWQWYISPQDIKNIKIPIYTISIGYNLFYGQNMGMPNRENDKFEQKRLDLFKESVEVLIDKSEYFSVRHNGDITNLKGVLGKEVHEKIKFQFCPSVEYCQDYVIKHSLKRANNSPPVWAFEIKSDREWRRYYNTSRKDFYFQIFKFIKHAPKLGAKLKIMIHSDGWEFVSFMKKMGITLDVIDNSRGEPRQRINNFMGIDVLFCMAGHSQMMGEALGCKTVSLITHNKLKYFLEDIGKYNDDNYVDVNEENVLEKLKTISKKLIK